MDSSGKILTKNKHDDIVDGVGVDGNGKAAQMVDCGEQDACENAEHEGSEHEGFAKRAYVVDGAENNAGDQQGGKCGEPAGEVEQADAGPEHAAHKEQAKNEFFVESGADAQDEFAENAHAGDV